MKKTEDQKFHVSVPLMGMGSKIVLEVISWCGPSKMWVGSARGNTRVSGPLRFYVDLEAVKI